MLDGFGGNGGYCYWRASGETACEGGVVMDVEFEKMEEGVSDDGDGAVEFYEKGRGLTYSSGF